jgi:Fic family protein
VEILQEVHKFDRILWMLDRTKPYNDLGGLPPNFNFDEVEILKLVNKATRALSSFNGASKALPNRNILIEPLSVKEAVASGGVENIHTTAEEVFRAELFPESEATDAQKETLHYKDALIDGWGLVLDKGFLNTNDYIKLQSKIEPDKTGIRRKEQTKEPVRIQNSKTGEIIYTPPEGYELLCELLKNYENYYNKFSDENDVDALIKLALLHYQFEAIHPFRDGNGRTGRILMVLYLVLTKRIDIPLLFISGYILKNRDAYYNRLQGVTERGEWKEWVIFILNAVINQSQESEKTVLGIKKLIEEYKDISMDSDLPDGTHVIDYLFSKPVYTYKDMAEKTNIHKNTATTYLNNLCNKNVLRKIKYKREALFYHPKFLDLL